MTYKRASRIKCGRAISFILIGLIMFNLLTLKVNALDEDSHYYLKYYLLRMVGFTHEEAEIIAKADVSIDKGDTSAGFAYKNNNPKYHALASKEENDARQKELWDGAMKALETGKTLEEKLIPFGQFLHFIEDRLAHEGFGWFWGHFWKGHEVDYLSYYSLEQLDSAISTWIQAMKDFLGSMGRLPNPITYDDVKKIVEAIRNANPVPQFDRSPDPSQAKKTVEAELGLKNCTLKLDNYYLFDKNGNKIGYIHPRKFLFFFYEQYIYNTTINDETKVIENSPFLESYPEAKTAIELLHSFTIELKYEDPKIVSLGCAIPDLIGLSQVDTQVMNVTTHLSLLMLDLVFKRAYHVEYLGFSLSIPNKPVFDEELLKTYENTEKAGVEIQKMEINPYDPNYYYLSGNLTESWEHLRTAEQIALTGVGGIVVPVDKFGLLAPYIGISSTITVAALAAAIYVKRVKRRKEKQ